MHASGFGRHAGVRSFFRHVPKLLGVPADLRLPVYSQREYSKSVWDMEVQGVRGVVNLVLIFPDQLSSLIGIAQPAYSLPQQLFMLQLDDATACTYASGVHPSCKV